jgi:hypothetical protein
MPQIPFLKQSLQIIIAPTFINLATAVDHLEFVGIDVAQNMHQSRSGAFTGEISADMLQNIGVYCNSWTFRTQSYFNVDELKAKYCFRARHDCDFLFW